jgi:glycosyltransferase involved in cell wall biosynthesis
MATKVMYLVDHYVGPQAGTEKQLLQLVQHLDRSRYEPGMTVFRSSEYVERNLFPCPVRVLGISKLASIRTFFRIMRYVITLRRDGYRLIHCFFNDSSLIAPFFLWLLDIRVLVSRRDMGFWYTPRNVVVLRLVAPFIDRYVANSQAVKQLVQQQEWVPSRKISVIYNGYVPYAESDSKITNAMKLFGITDDGPVLGIIANLKPIKRIDELIDAFALVNRQYPDARLVIIGGDNLSPNGTSMLADLKGLAHRLGIHERVIFTGLLNDPAPYINRFTVAILCSKSEGFSNSIIEYMQAGRPIVCTDTGGNPELVQDGYNGFLIPVDDVGALADRVLQLLSDSALARRLGEAARETVRSLYTHTRMVTEQMACYDEILSNSRSGWKFYRWLGRTRQC